MISGTGIQNCSDCVRSSGSGRRVWTLTFPRWRNCGGEGASPRPHFAQVLVRGDVSTNREAFDRYPDTEEFRRRVKWLKADAKTCVEAIKSAE